VTVIEIIIIVIAIAAGIHIYGNYQNRYNPPASCQLLGGHWDIWGGWQCG
jgi:hypothetical protein